MSKSTKRAKSADFSDMSTADVYRMLYSTAVVARQDHPLVVRNGKGPGGQRGVIVFMPGYEVGQDGLVKVVDDGA